MSKPVLAASYMSIEGFEPQENPTRKQLFAALERLTPYGEPGFLILSTQSENYIQTAGGLNTFTVECREYSGVAFSHYVGGRNPVEDRRVTVETNGYEVQVLASEVLGLDEVRDIFGTYFESQRRTDGFHWRDNTQQFEHKRPWWKFWVSAQ